MEEINVGDWIIPDKDSYYSQCGDGYVVRDGPEMLVCFPKWSDGHDEGHREVPKHIKKTHRSMWFVNRRTIRSRFKKKNITLKSILEGDK